MSTITKEQAKDLRNAFQSWKQDYNPVEDKEQHDMFGLGVVAMDALLASLEAEPVGYMNRFTGRVFTLEEQPGADTDLEHPARLLVDDLDGVLTALRGDEAEGVVVNRGPTPVGADHALFVERCGPGRRSRSHHGSEPRPCARRDRCP